jgi:hypothetical protein
MLCWLVGQVRNGRVRAFFKAGKRLLCRKKKKIKTSLDPNLVVKPDPSFEPIRLFSQSLAESIHCWSGGIRSSSGPAGMTRAMHLPRESGRKGTRDARLSCLLQTSPCRRGEAYLKRWADICINRLGGSSEVSCFLLRAGCSCISSVDETGPGDPPPGAPRNGGLGFAKTRVKGQKKTKKQKKTQSARRRWQEAHFFPTSRNHVCSRCSGG